MNIAARILTGLLALIGLVTGLKTVFGGIESIAASPFLDNSHRFLAGIWLGVGMGLAYCTLRWSAKDTPVLLRALMLTIFVGGVARAIGLIHYAPETRIVVATAIELIVPPIVVWMQSRGAGKS